MAKAKAGELKSGIMIEMEGVESSPSGRIPAPEPVEIRATGLSKSESGYTVHELVIRGGSVVSDKVVRGPTSKALARAYLTRQGVASVIL